MISFIKSTFPVKRKLILYSQKPALKEGIFNEYMQSFYQHKVIGFKRYAKYTKLIDISNDTFNDSFTKTTMYEIRRAKSEPIICQTSNDIKGYINFYNKFLIEKKLPGLLTENELARYGSSLLLRCATIKDQPYFVYHSYLIDSSIKRARLLHSVSDIHNGLLNSEQKAILSKANRLLHYEDMLYLRDIGCKTYDFGGYAYGTADKSLQGINLFKDSFGGLLVEESNYDSYFLYMIKSLVNSIKGLINRN